MLKKFIPNVGKKNQMTADYPIRQSSFLMPELFYLSKGFVIIRF